MVDELLSLFFPILATPLQYRLSCRQLHSAFLAYGDSGLDAEGLEVVLGWG